MKIAKLWFIDLDDTLFYPNSYVKLFDPNSDDELQIPCNKFSEDQLPDGWEADYYHWRCTKSFVNLATPIPGNYDRIMNELGAADAIMRAILTARGSFDNQTFFAQYIQYKLDDPKLHFLMTGDMQGVPDWFTPKRKAYMANMYVEYYRYHKYDHIQVHMADDKTENLVAMSKEFENDSDVSVTNYLVQDTAISIYKD
jgi:hypothetical protein